MKLLIIYGPEASGKLTVGQEVARLTGFRLAHNHLTADLATSLFDYGTREHSELVWVARLLVFETVAKHGLKGLIFTWAFSYPDFMPYLERMKEALRAYETEFLYVYLTCSETERRRRVQEESRRKHGKLTTIAGLEAAAGRKRYGAIPEVENLVIDNTELASAAVAKHIVENYRLPNHQ